jgi:hypothetical protein
MGKLLKDLKYPKNTYLQNILSNEFILCMYNQAVTGENENIGIDIPFNEDWSREDFDLEKVKMTIPLALPLSDSEYIEFYFVIDNGIEIHKYENSYLFRVNIKGFSQWDYSVVNEKLTSEK